MKLSSAPPILKHGGGASGSPKLNRGFWWTKVTFGVLNVPRGGGTGLGLSPKFYHFFSASLMLFVYTLFIPGGKILYYIDIDPHIGFMRALIHWII